MIPIMISNYRRNTIDWDFSAVPIFTQKEKEFIKNAGVLKAAYDPAWPPIEYYDEETGKFSGIKR